MMDVLKLAFILPFGIFVAFAFDNELYGCNEAVCASVVSKCMLIKSCECDMTESSCTCCKDCYKCLHDLYTDCCSCVGLCPSEPKIIDELSQKSAVEDLGEPVPILFNVLTEEDDHLLRWTSEYFPQDDEINAVFQPDSPHTALSTSEINCTVAYMSQCMSMHKCKISCSSMGASKYRWFYDGCCECVGHTCINYGKNQSNCLRCPEDKSQDLESEYYYDESDAAEEDNENPDDDVDYYENTQDIVSKKSKDKSYGL